MDSITRKYLNKLLNILPEKKILELMKMISENKISKNSTTYDLKDKLDLSSEEIKITKQILLNLEPESILIALDLLREIKNQKYNILQNTSLSWTSPVLFHKKADTTKNTIIEMINSSKKSITFVGYYIMPDTEEIFDALIDAANRGIQIRLLFDKARKFIKTIKKIWQNRAPFPLVYTYKSKEEKSSLHAKVLIIDSEQLLITSANLTGRAITRNVEIGIKHIGKSAKDAEELVDSLVENKFLEVIE
jgi:HKD family nuclease